MQCVINWFWQKRETILYCLSINDNTVKLKLRTTWVLVLLLLTPALMMTRTLRDSVLSHPRMSIGCCVDCCTRDTLRVRLALHRQKCVYIPTRCIITWNKVYFLSFVAGSPSLNDLKNYKTWLFQGSSRSCHVSSCGSRRVVGSNTAGKNSRAGTWSRSTYKKLWALSN